MKDLSAVKRYTTIVRKPFTTLDFIEDTGYPKKRAIRVLNLAVRLALLNYLGGVGEARTYVPIPPKTPKYYDFSPQRDKLIRVQACLKKNRYLHWTQIIEETGMGKRTLQRYLSMLAHLGCAKERITRGSRGRPSHQYLRTDEPAPQCVPPYFRTLSSAWRQP